MTRITLCSCCGNQLVEEWDFTGSVPVSRWVCAGFGVKTRDAAIVTEASDVFSGSDYVRRLKVVKALGPEAMTKLAEALGIPTKDPSNMERAD